MGGTTNVTKMMAIAMVLVACLAATATAGDVDGTWKWSFQRQNGESIENTLVLKSDGEKLTGTVSRGDRETEISDGTVKDGEVSFKVSRERNGQTFSATYKAKVDGDTLKGTIDFDFNGQTRSRDWEAKREK